MAARRTGRIDLRDQIKANRAALLLYAAGRPLMETPDSLKYLDKPRRKNKPRVESEDDPYESTIQADIIAMLKKHPKVALVERINSGKAKEIGADGKPRFIPYNKVYRVNGIRMRKSDIDCTLINGKRFVCEVKRKDWKRPTDTRETEQANYIASIKASTGYGMFARSVAEVEAYLETIAV